MVNTNSSTRNLILNLLLGSKKPFSGNEIGRKLGISRVAVWKQIQQLETEGYTILSSSSGYTLAAEPDHLTPTSREYSSQQVKVKECVGSTMEMASGPSGGGIRFYIARQQKHGRGRSGKDWISPEGGLYLTMTFSPQIPAAYCGIYTVSAGMAAAAALNRTFNTKCRFSWPNDITRDRAKLGGLLLELEGELDSPATARLGFGMNISASPNSEHRLTGSLADHSTRNQSQINPKSVFSLLKPVLEKVAEDCTPDTVRSQWEENSDEMGTTLVLNKTQYIIAGMTLGGSLILEDAGGIPWEVAPGWTFIGPCRRI